MTNTNKIKSFELINGIREILSINETKSIVASLLLIKNYNQDLLEEFIKGNDTKKLVAVFNEARNHYALELQDIHFEETLTKLSGSRLISLVLFINELALDESNDVLMTAITIDKDGGAHITSESINQLMMRIAELGPDLTILDPTFGMGTSFEQLIRRNPEQKIVGQEINGLTFDLAQIKMICLGAKNVQLYKGDVLAKPQYVQNGDLLKYDRVISNPPIGLRESGNEKYNFEQDPYQRYSLGEPQKSNLDWAFISNGISSLNSEGRGVFLVSNRALFGGGANNRIRKNAIRADLIEGVISLPGGLAAPYSQIALSLIIVNKDKGVQKDKIKFVSGEQFLARKQQGAKIMLSNEDIQDITNCYFATSDQVGFSKTVSHQVVVENEAFLVPSSYLFANEYQLSSDLRIRLNKDKWDERTKVPLSSITEISRGYNTVAKDEKSDGEYALIKISDINEGQITYGKLARTNVKSNTQVQNYQISTGDILLSIKGTTDKLAFVSESRDNTLITQNLVCIRANRERIYPQWLYEYLNSPVGLSQLRQAQVGTTISQIPIKALEEVLVPELSLAEQTRAIEEYQAKKVVLDEQLKKLTQELEKAKQKLYQNMTITDLYDVVENTKYEGAN
ncbi:MAG: N-6 DNA methylase [Vagococcus salmoninarum]|uniref:N-6 DNA methylase n=1 Tax=Vagococcus salmoninarum TaxID=2739 RepID=UPI003F99F560